MDLKETKLRYESNLAKMARWAPIPLRLIVGYGFLAHGYAKVAKGPEQFFTILNALGVPAPHFMGGVTILIEILGGLAVLAGAFVVLASVPMVAVLLVAMVTVHLPYGFSSIKLLAVTTAGAQFGPPGFEVDLLYIACLVALVLGGSGPFSVDRVRARIARNGVHLRCNADALSGASARVPVTKTFCVQCKAEVFLPRRLR